MTLAEQAAKEIALKSPYFASFAEAVKVYSAIIASHYSAEKMAEWLMGHADFVDREGEMDEIALTAAIQEFYDGGTE